MMDDTYFEQIAGNAPTEERRAPAKLKARIYTSLVRAQQEEGPLESLSATKLAGHGLCVFEQLVEIAPVGTTVKSKFCCSVCHARILAEHMDHAPIWWPHCPYAGFQKS